MTDIKNSSDIPDEPPKSESSGVNQSKGANQKGKKTTKKAASAPARAGKVKAKPSPAREIPGQLPYTLGPGVFKKALEGIVVAARPPRFSGDFLGTVLNLTGGSAKAIPPILKRTGFISSDGTPTDIYSRFKSETGRSQAALDALRTGYPAIFKRNDYAHRATGDQIKDIIVEITGLNKNDSIVRAISGTFEAIRSFVDSTKISSEPDNKRPIEPEEDYAERSQRLEVGNGTGFQLVYNINVVLPDKADIATCNAIFKSLRENLLR
jgi:hypothetical protein